jgi:hypothetical protein
MGSNGWTHLGSCPERVEWRVFFSLYVVANTCIRFKLNAIVTSFHSPDTAANPRKENCAPAPIFLDTNLGLNRV